MKDVKGALALGLLAVFVSSCAASMACRPGEPSVHCCIKKFPLTPLESCGINAAEALTLLQAMEMAGEIADEVDAADEADDSTTSAAPEPPNCDGQNHHVISNPIAKKLATHKILAGLYKPRDPRFVARAINKQAHCGYQRWHRELDKEVVKWLQKNEEASPEEFEAYLREVYNRSGLRARFPHGF